MVCVRVASPYLTVLRDSSKPALESSAISLNQTGARSEAWNGCLALFTHLGDTTRPPGKASDCQTGAQRQGKFTLAHCIWASILVYYVLSGPIVLVKGYSRLSVNLGGVECYGRTCGAKRGIPLSERAAWRSRSLS